MKKKWIIAQGLAFEEEQEKLRLEKLAQDAPKLREALAGEPASDGTEAVLGLIREISR